MFALHDINLGGDSVMFADNIHRQPPVNTNIPFLCIVKDLQDIMALRLIEHFYVGNLNFLKKADGPGILLVEVFRLLITL